MKRVLLSLAVGALVLGGIQREAVAGIVTFSGSDDGAPITGPFPNSAAAQTNFLAAASALGPTNTITFENLPLGYYTPFTAATGVSVAINAPNFGDGFSGISTTTFGNLYGFNTTPGGSKWLGFPEGSATFSFASPTQSFGFYLTGVQTLFSSSIDVTFSDGSSQDLNAPINVNGGASYFGFTDAGKSIASVTITNIGNDAWGIDDVTYNSSPVATPEPASICLMGMGIGMGLAGYGWRRRKAARA
jgi:hypothetical protein